MNGTPEQRRRYAKQWRIEYARTGYRRIPAGPVSDRVHYWLGLGYSRSQIAAAAQCSREEIGSLERRSQPTIHRDVARRILAVRLTEDDRPDGLHVDATGTRRRLQALLVIGHPLGVLAADIGHASNALGKIVNGHYGTVRLSTARAVADLYRRRAHTPGSCERTRRRAIKEGWAGPLAWDDGAIDDPAMQPEIDLDAAGEPDKDALRESLRTDVVHLAEFGIPIPEIAARMGMCRDTIRKTLKQEAPHLLLRLTA